MSASGLVSISKVRSRNGAGFYFRVGHNDHVTLNRLIAERKLQANGLVLDARRHSRHGDLRQQAAQLGLDACLDTQAMELAFGATSKGHLELPWAKDLVRSPQDFSADFAERFVRSIVQRVSEGGYSEVIAPAHYLPSADSEWLEVDRMLTHELRTQLDQAKLHSVRIIYPLAVHSSSFYDASDRLAILGALSDLPIDAICFRIHPFGSTSGPQAMRSFIEACYDFRRLQVPLVASRAGISAVAAYALNAVDIIESGVTIGDSFNIAKLQKSAAKNSPFSPPQMVYVEALGTSIKRDVAAKLMSTARGKTHFACRDRSCCPNGFKDMLGDSERHSALARQRQYMELSNMPSAMRAEYFIHEVLAPMCDKLARATDYDPSFKAAQRRMLSVKEMLLALQREQKKARIAATMRRHWSAEIIPLTPREPRGR